MADVNERLEKQMEGTNLALAAVAEVLQKMDGRLAKEEEVAAANAQIEADTLAKAQFVKSIAAEVKAVLKGDSYAGSDASGDERKAGPTGSTPQSADDSESDAKIESKIEAQQNTIQAMKKTHDSDEDDEEMEKDEDKDEKGMYKGDDAEDDEAADEPIEEKGMDDEDEDDDADEMKSMKKQLQTLKKQLASTEANIKKSVQTESEARLRKLGFREETGLQAPKIVNSFGTDNTTPIQKSNTNLDTPDQLAQLSYSELRRMQHQIDSGNTEGIPRELLEG